MHGILVQNVTDLGKQLSMTRILNFNANGNVITQYAMILLPNKAEHTNI